VNRLPPEILGHIFNLRYNTFDVRETCRDTAGSFALSHVCHQWREAALGNPHLWNDIDERWCNAAQEALIDRSGATGLTVQMKTMYHGVKGALTPVTGPRIWELRWTNLDDNDLERLQFRAEKLQILAIIGYQMNTDNTSNFRFRALFDGHLPHLQRLALSRTTWLPRNPLSNLKFLILVTVLTPLASLLELLSTCPSLVLVYLSNLRTGYTDTVDDGPIASLPNLRILALFELRVKTAVSLLSHILLPTSTTVRIKAHDEWNVDKAHGLSSISPMEIVTKLKISMWQRCIKVTAAGPMSGIVLEMREPDSGILDFDQLSTSILPSILPMKQIREFWLKDPYTTQCVVDIRTILRGLPSLEVLGLPVQYIDMLCELVRTPSDSVEGGSVLCPELRVLHVRSCHDDEPREIINLLKNVESSWKQSPRGARTQLEYVTIDRLLRDLPSSDDEYATNHDDYPLSLEIQEYPPEKAPRMKEPPTLTCGS